MSLIAGLIEGDYKSANTADQAQLIQDAYAKQFPNAVNTETSQLTPIAQARLNTAQAVTPGYNDLALNEYDRNQARASAIQGRYDAAQAGNDVNNLNQYGVQAGRALLAADNAANPQAAAVRAGAGTKYGQLLDNLDPNLSAGTRAEIERGTSRLSPSGAQNSAVSTAEKAMQFGSAHEAHLNNFANVLNGVSAALPQLKTGLNPASIALGRDSRTSPIAGGLTGATAADNTAFSRGAQIMNGLTGLQQNKTSIDAGKWRTVGDQLEQDSRIASNLGSAASSAAAA